MLKKVKSALSQQVFHAVQEFAHQSTHGSDFVLNLTEADVLKALELPKNRSHGQLAFPVFILAKALKQAPPVIAQALAGKLTMAPIRQAQAVGGFVNLTLEDGYLEEILLEDLAGNLAKKLGHSQNGVGRTLVIDYSSPNIAKPMSIGHLRATVIGQAVRNLAETQGYKVIGINHLGDWGSQFGKLTYAYLKYGSEYDFKTAPFESLFKIYVRFHEEAEKDPELESKGAEYFRRLEQGDPEVREIWERFREISIQDYKRLYDLLGVHHELVQGEAFYNDKLEETIDRIRAAGILEESQGAQVVFVGENKPPCIVRKSDGSSIYATRDIASAIYRKEVLKGDEILYVVGVDQTLHFEQVFEVLRKMGYDWSSNCHHIAFGMYRFKDMGRMSTRRGNVIFMEDVLDRAIQEVDRIISEKNPALENREKVAQQVGIGAVVFNDLVNDRVRNVDFDWERVLDFEGNSGPYVQYCLVRCKSLERKWAKPIELTMPASLTSEQERSLLFTLLSLDEVLEGAYRTYKPNILAMYLLDVCRDFNHFYHAHKILQEPSSDLRLSRLALVKATQMVLEKGLAVLGVPAPDQM